PKHKLKSKIIDCYAEGMGINAICRVFKVEINSLKTCIKQEGEEFIQPDIEEIFLILIKSPTKLKLVNYLLGILLTCFL
ncbi:MAG: Unknown protein, partial [uncultured Sulfurovum sp.]